MQNDSNKEVQEVKELFTCANIKQEVDNQSDFDRIYADMRVEQSNRTKEVTEILTNYKTQQLDRSNFRKLYKTIIFWFSVGLIIGFVALIAYIIIHSFCIDTIDNNTLVSLITSLVTGVTSIITILVIIVKYVFPADEESNFNDLVKEIIKQDTERIKNDTNTHNKV